MSLLNIALNRLIRHGVLNVIEADGSQHSHGTPTPGYPEVTLRLTDGRVGRDIVRHPQLGLPEAYIEGRIIVEKGDVWDLVMLAKQNGAWEDKGPKRKGPIKATAKAITRRFNHMNYRAQAKKNVAHHYDLGDRLYDLFLDRDRQYSCAYFTDPANDIEQAQSDKKAHIAAKLHLKPGQHVLDIGCGWGGMALYLNERCGVRVTGITLSEDQLRIARERAAAAGVSESVKFELIDYRDVGPKLGAPFDRIVSVGMFEHVGAPFYGEFFRTCRELLTRDGVMLLHTIGRIGGPHPTDAFTRKYSFPGAYVPALSEITTASEGARLLTSDIETLRLHYALTLRRWYDSAVAAKAQIEALYDANFYRMWTLYLAGAAAGFEYGGTVNYQIQYVRDRRALPITRDYMFEGERRLRG